MQIRSYMESNQGWNEIRVADSGLFVKIKGEEIYDSKEVKTKGKVPKITPSSACGTEGVQILFERRASIVGKVKHASKQSLNVSTEKRIYWKCNFAAIELMLWIDSLKNQNPVYKGFYHRQWRKIEEFQS